MIMLQEHLFTPSLAHSCNLFKSLKEEDLSSLFPDILPKFKIKYFFLETNICTMQFNQSGNHHVLDVPLIVSRT